MSHLSQSPIGGGPTLLSKADALALQGVATEINKIREKHVPLHNPHHAYAVILEEVDEFWEQVRKKRSSRDPAAMAHELTQIAAVATRAIADLGLLDPNPT